MLRTDDGGDPLYISLFKWGFCRYPGTGSGPGSGLPNTIQSGQGPPYTGLSIKNIDTRVTLIADWVLFGVMNGLSTGGSKSCPLEGHSRRDAHFPPSQRKLKEQTWDHSLTTVIQIVSEAWIILDAWMKRKTRPCPFFALEVGAGRVSDRRRDQPVSPGV